MMTDNATTVADPHQPTSPEDNTHHPNGTQHLEACNQAVRKVIEESSLTVEQRLNNAVTMVRRSLSESKYLSAKYREVLYREKLEDNITKSMNAAKKLQPTLMANVELLCTPGSHEGDNALKDIRSDTAYEIDKLFSNMFKPIDAYLQANSIWLPIDISDQIPNVDKDARSTYFAVFEVVLRYMLQKIMKERQDMVEDILRKMLTGEYMNSYLLAANHDQLLPRRGAPDEWNDEGVFIAEPDVEHAALEMFFAHRREEVNETFKNNYGKQYDQLKEAVNLSGFKIFMQYSCVSSSTILSH